MKQLLTLLALVLCSCAETFVGEEATRPNNENLPDLTAAFAEEDNTRTYIEDGKYLRWHEDDRLTIFYGNTLNRQYKFNGATGDNSGTFSLVPDGMLGTGNAFDHIYALYPYNADARITDEGIISLTLPAEQTYAENSFGRGANTMIERVAIAGVIAMMPECIIFDESTAMLDPVGRREVLDTIQSLNREQGITILNITHYMNEAALADRVVVINDGEIIMDGTPDQIFARRAELKQVGLEVPQCAETIHRLRECGIPLDGEKLSTVEDCAELILKAFGK